MFGIFRTLLALAVVVAHLLRFQSLGEHAVHGFFILSGYLMTKIMHRNYGYSFRGVQAFALNRFLRLYPSYWIILGFILITGSLVGEQLMNDFHPALRFPENISEWVKNIFFIYPSIFPTTVSPRLSPATWALTVELCFYTIIALGASRSKNTTMIWFIVSIGYLAYTHVAGLGYDYRYLGIPAASLPFALGALCYHYEDRIKSAVKYVNPIGALMLLGFLFAATASVSAVTKQLLTGDLIRSLCAYLNLPIVFLIICILMTKPNLHIPFEIDKRIGDFSYPLYLVHWQAGLLASVILYGHCVRGHSLEALMSFALALVFCVIVCGAVVTFIDPMTDRLRTKIKLGLRK